MIFSQSANIQNIQYNNRYCDTSTPYQKEIFLETETGSSSDEDASRRDTDDPEGPASPARSHSDQQESHSDSTTSRTNTPSQSEITQYTENIVDSNSYSTSTSSQSEIYSSNAEYEAGSESSSRETSRPSSPEAGSHQNRSLHSPLPEMAMVTKTFQDAIHAVWDQQQRPVTRHLLQQQIQLASQKAMVNLQIKISTPDPPKSNAKHPPR